MSVRTEENLTLAEAARIMRDAVKDRSYRATPLGLEVAKYYRWKKNEWGATATTLRDYEAPLALLALDHADLELQDFEPPIGTERLREFWDLHWADRSPRTRAKILSILRDFFGWAVNERKDGPSTSGSSTATPRRPCGLRSAEASSGARSTGKPSFGSSPRNHACVIASP